MIRNHIPWRTQLEMLDAADRIGLSFMASVQVGIVLASVLAYFPRLFEAYRVLSSVALVVWSVWFAVGLRHKARGNG